MKIFVLIIISINPEHPGGGLTLSSNISNDLQSKHTVQNKHFDKSY